MKNKMLSILIVLDLFWSFAALVYDWNSIGQIPIYFWPFIIICPIYPFLLAIVWYYKVRIHHINSYLLAFAAIPSMVYFIGALIYYPTLMVTNGFNVWGFLSIFWVAFYGLQGFYLIIKKPSPNVPIILAICFILISFIIQYLTRTYGYLDFAGLDNQAIIIIYIFTIINLILYLIVLKKLQILFLKKVS